MSKSTQSAVSYKSELIATVATFGGVYEVRQDLDGAAGAWFLASNGKGKFAAPELVHEAEYWTEAMSYVGRKCLANEKKFLEASGVKPKAAVEKKKADKPTVKKATKEEKAKPAAKAATTTGPKKAPTKTPERKAAKTAPDDKAATAAKIIARRKASAAK